MLGQVKHAAVKLEDAVVGAVEVASVARYLFCRVNRQDMALQQKLGQEGLFAEDALEDVVV